LFFYEVFVIIPFDYESITRLNLHRTFPIV